MTFGEELCNLSSNVSLEMRVWEKMKPYLREIANSNHAKGCHVVFEGVTKTFIKEINNVIKQDSIVFDYHNYGLTDNIKTYADIIWKDDRRYTSNMFFIRKDISSKMLRVELTKSGEVSIEIEILDKEHRYQDAYTYVD